MTLREFLRAETIRIDPPCRDKWELIRELVGLAVDDELGAPESVVEVVVARERQLSTGLERGIALPHGMLPGDFRPRAALAVLREGLDFAALDGAPVHFVALVLFPDDEEGRRTHVELLGATIDAFTRPAVREAVLAAPDPAGVLAALGEV